MAVSAMFFFRLSSRHGRSARATSGNTTGITSRQCVPGGIGGTSAHHVADRFEDRLEGPSCHSLMEEAERDLMHRQRPAALDSP
jgi:hypothetical protein